MVDWVVVGPAARAAAWPEALRDDFADSVFGVAEFVGGRARAVERGDEGDAAVGVDQRFERGDGGVTVHLVERLTHGDEMEGAERGGEVERGTLDPMEG